MESSESLYNGLLSGNPSQETIYRLLSMMKKEGLIERVTGECVKALESYPDDVRIRRLLAEAYFESGKIYEAESEIREVIARVNELMTCYRFQADLMINQGRNGEAVEALKLYLIHCPDDKEAYDLLESLMPEEEPPVETTQEEEVPAPFLDEDTALEQPVEEELPEIATATLAEVYFNQGRTEEAIEIYKKVIDNNPDDSAPRARLEELKAMAEQARSSEEKEKDILRRKKRMVSILESWLEGIRQQSRPGLSAG